MIEMRYVVPAGAHTPLHFPRLQYRFLSPTVDASGALTPYGAQWSEWADVPVIVVHAPIANCPDKAPTE